jgi:hypothetical protein
MTPVRFLIALVLATCVVLPAHAERAMAPSDPEAKRLARRVLKAMGGRDAWNETRYLAWNFFGKRFHVWDTWTGDLRTDAYGGYTVLMNVNTMEGRVLHEGREFEGEELADALQKAKWSWINDSYWLVMPFKLLDEGVRLRGPRWINQPDGDRALALRLNFDQVGRTPWNSYEVHVDPDDHVVNGWSFYRNASDREPAFELPWVLERRGRILLPVSHGRGGTWKVEVFDEVPRSVFEALEPTFDMEALLAIATPAERVEPKR